MSSGSPGRAEASAPLAALDGAVDQGVARKRFGVGPQSLAQFRHFMVARHWLLLAPSMIAAMGIVAAATSTWPGPLSGAVAFAAIVITAAAPLFARIERNDRRSLLERYLIMAVAVALPMFLFGFALARWGHSATAGLGGVIAALIAVGALAGIVLHGRLTASLSAQFGLWLGVAVVGGSLATFAVLVVAAGFGVYLAYRQIRIFTADEEARRDIEREQARAKMLLAEYEAMGQGWFWEIDRRGRLTYVSPGIAALLGYAGGDLVGRPFTDLFVLDGTGQKGERTLHFHLSARSSFTDLAARAATPGEERWWSISGRPIHDKFDNFLGFRGSGCDLTEKRRTEAHASHLARYDALTGLANRVQMAQSLEKIINAPRDDHRSCVVMLLDLDRFKQVNDTLGHPAGDALLKQVAQRLQRTVGEAGRVGRLGGDEFQILFPGRFARDDLAQMARLIIENLSQPYSIEGRPVVIGASVGIALSPEDGATSESLIRNADLALYAAKDGGRGRHHFYAADLLSDAEERRMLEQDLRDAIVHGGLELHYQPVVRTTTEKITGFEALIRWNHPVKGRLSPAKFIPVAEETGLIARIGEWALRTACREMASWCNDVRVAVNVSPLQFANPELPRIVANALETAGVAPGRLELEITESVFLNDDGATDAMFAALKKLGVRLALDDFGTGYSSLGYLKKAPFDKIKIDQSFVRGATIDGSRNGAIIASIVSLADALGMETTAEGVETLDELDLIRELGCSHVQGYIYEKPMSAGEAAMRLRSGFAMVASGPRSSRSARQKMLRRVVLECDGERYDGVIRNISTTGAMIEGLWNVPPGVEFAVHMSPDYVVAATARWSKEDRMGVEFAVPLHVDLQGGVLVSARARPRVSTEDLLRKAG